MKFHRIAALAGAVLAFAAAAPSAQVVLVEGGHQLIQHVDSSIPLDPTQDRLDDGLPIESIAVDPGTGDIYVQSVDFINATSAVHKIVGGVVTPVNLNTGFAISSRGTDMHWDKARELLVTYDHQFLPEQGWAGGPGGRVATPSSCSPSAPPSAWTSPRASATCRPGTSS